MTQSHRHLLWEMLVHPHPTRLGHAMLFCCHAVHHGVQHSGVSITAATFLEKNTTVIN